MNRTKIISLIFLVLIVLIGSNVAFAQDIADDLSVNDNLQSINENTNILSSSQQTIRAGSNTSTIQNTINSMTDGDVLNFENGTYTDISLYVDKNITINGNGATLIGYDTSGVNNSNVPEKVRATTANGGYAVSNFATLYLLNTTDITLNGLTIVGKNSTTYSNAALYIGQVSGVKVINNTIDGSSWGIYMTTSPDGIIKDNIIKNQKTTGLLNFGSARTLITNNTVINATNHGIDVRHGTGPNVEVINNTVIGSKEGIYLMHSKGHTVTENTLINCTISSITCYGSSEVNIYNNTMYKSRIGVLLGGGYTNITIGENDFNLDNLPYPPTFVYYVATAESDYQGAEEIIGTYSDSTSNNITYTNITNIPTPKDVQINYAELTKATGTTYNVTAGASSSDIQKIIDSMNDNDTLSFEKNAVYENISIYTDKNIKIIGNNATLIGYTTPGVNKSNIPEKVWKTTNESGYAEVYFAVLYILNNTNVVVSNLNIVGKGAEYNTATVTTTTDEYKSASIYADNSKNLTITNCDISGSSWGIFLQYSGNSIITNNNVHDQYTTGIMNFGSPENIIANNTVTNAINHGIDVRHGTGPNVYVFNNTISDAKEGIYLMHSRGHMVYNNTILNSKISSVTAYGSTNEYIFNNTFDGSRIAVLLGGGYANVTIGENNYNLDFLPYPPTFTTYIAFADLKYQSSENVQGTYSDGAYIYPATIIAEDANFTSTSITYNATLKNNDGANQANETLIFEINGKTYTATTNSNGVASITTILSNGEYNVLVTFEGNNKLGKKTAQSTINVNSTNAADLTAPDVTLYYKNGTRFTATLTQNGTAIANATVIFKINGIDNKRTTNENGTASIAINLNSGVYSVETVFEGNDKYDAASADSTVTVLTTVNGTDVTKVYRNGTQYWATFVDGKGNYLANGSEVRFNINGVFYTRYISGDEGKARLNLNLEQGSYVLTAINPVTGENSANNITILPTMSENKDIVKYYRNATQYVLDVIGLDGKIVGAGENVTFNINGVFYNRTTNTTGQAKLNLNLQPGNYIITAEYKGCKVSNNITVLPVLNATDLVKKYGESDAFVATLVNGSGDPQANTNVTFNINGVFYNRTTNTTGQAKLNINLQAGEYIITSSYNGSNIANKVTVTA